MADNVTSGSLTLVGIGPGGLDYLTRRAERAICDADVVVGYRLYLELIIPLIEDKQYLEFPMGAEFERAQESVRRALDGERVALVTGGDPGIYGMAAPTYQALNDLDESQVAAVNLEVIPGVTAATASAAIVGTPLIQDFAVISLSDRFVPWEVIEKRLRNTLDADLAVVIYEPASRHRPSHMMKAWRIISEYREPDSPIAVVRDATRPDQTATLSTVAEMMNLPYDMKTTVIIGNSTSYIARGLLMTPREHPEITNK